MTTRAAVPTKRRFWIPMFAFIVGVSSLVVAPAHACGCGAIIPSGGDASVFEERALVRFAGGTEQITMGFSVEGSSEEAAWIMPVPDRARLSVGDHRLFTELDDLTQPIEQTRYTFSDESMNTGSGSPGGSAVSVLQRQTLGPFEVTTLDASDPQALERWLDDNGYELPQGTAESLAPYVDEGWLYVAARLKPGVGDALEGELDPLSVEFSSDRIVYPMRASSNAEGPLNVLVYVLAPHRVEPPEVLGNLLPPATLPSDTMTYAGWIGPDSSEQYPALGPFLDDRLFLTKFTMSLWDPSLIEEDFVFSYASNDDAYRLTRVDHVYISPWLVVVGVALAAALAALVYVRLRQRS